MIHLVTFGKKNMFEQVNVIWRIHLGLILQPDCLVVVKDDEENHIPNLIMFFSILS